MDKKENLNEPSTAIELFIWRRAFRSPERRVSRSDVMLAIGVSHTTASRALSDAAAASKGLLVRKDKWVEAQPWAITPHFVNEEDLMAALLAGRDEFADLGLTPEELPIKRNRWSEEMPFKPGVLACLVEKTTRQKSVYLQFVDLEKPGQAEWVRIVPLGIEQHGSQFHLLAQDVDASSLARPVRRLFSFRGILGVRDDPKSLPRRFTLAGHHDSPTHIAATPHHTFEDDQKSAIESVFLIKKGKIELASRSVDFFVNEQRQVGLESPCLLEISR